MDYRSLCRFGRGGLASFGDGCAVSGVVEEGLQDNYVCCGFSR